MDLIVAGRCAIRFEENELGARENLLLDIARGNLSQRTSGIRRERTLAHRVAVGNAFVVREIPPPAGESAGVRDDALSGEWSAARRRTKREGGVTHVFRSHPGLLRNHTSGNIGFDEELFQDLGVTSGTETVLDLIPGRI